MNQSQKITEKTWQHCSKWHFKRLLTNEKETLFRRLNQLHVGCFEIKTNFTYKLSSEKFPKEKAQKSAFLLKNFPNLVLTKLRNK